MSDVIPRNAAAVARTDFLYRYNTTDDLFSLRRWLARSLSPETAGPNGTTPAAGNPYLYLELDEGEFQRPSITVDLIESGLADPGQRVMVKSYQVEHSIELRAYGTNRANTIALADRLWDALNDVGTDAAPFRPQMWSRALDARLARRMRVLQTSMTMSLLQTDDEGKESRAVTLRLQAPRLRSSIPGPVFEAFSEEVSVVG